MDPSAPARWATSNFVRRMMSSSAAAKRRAKAESARRKAGLPHCVEYFHQIEDGYSHLAAQLLRSLLDRYDVELVCHLVDVRNDDNLPEPDLLLPLSRYDAGKVAPHYRLQFPEAANAPDPKHLELAKSVLAGIESQDFPEAVVAIGNALWSGEAATLDILANRYGRVDPAAVEARIASGVERRANLGHYSAAMFHYAGEWYWGADRFDLLEKRLIALGARRVDESQTDSRGDDSDRICPRPAIEAGPLKDKGTLTFEIYASLRSPYTSIIFDRALQLGQDSGVKTVVRPVLPMVMRGVSATRQKGLYIFSDAAREAEAMGLDWGDFYDPIGEPVRNCYSLYSWAREQGKEIELLSSFLRAAFFQGVNTNNDAGMRIVVEQAGLSFDDAKAIMGNDDWQSELEANRLAMYDFGCWGVPSFRLLDAKGETALALWGQDRLWLFAREIQRLLREA